MNSMQPSTLNNPARKRFAINRQIVLSVIVFILLLLFFYTGFDKILRSEVFVASLDKSVFLSMISFLLKYLLPGWEFLVAILLLIPSQQKRGLLLAFLTMSFFTVYVAYMLLFVPDLPCSCGGFIGLLSWKQHLVFNTALSIIAYVGYRLKD